MAGKDDRNEQDEFGELEDLDESEPDGKGGLFQRASKRILEYWQRRTHRGKTGTTLTLVELEVARVQEQREHEKDLAERFDEPGIGERKAGFPFMAYFVYPVIGLLIVGLPIAVVIQKIKAKELGEAPKRDSAAVLPIDESAFTDESAREVAESFLNATSLDDRLARVRDPEAVRERLAKYSDQSRTVPIRFAAIQPLGLASASGEARFHRFMVHLPDGGSRLLPVVQTARGPLVDYDAFARYGSAGWEEILQGAAAAELRVVARRSTYHQFAFEDEQKWMSFELSNPDWPATLTGYARRDSVTAGTLSAITGLKGKQRVMLAIRPEGDSHLQRQVIIEKVLASGWVRTEGDLESRWLLKGQPKAAE